MDPRQMMRRTQKTLLGISCIAGGCAALVCLLSYSDHVERFLSSFESGAHAAEQGSFSGSGAELIAETPIDDKALINDLHVTDKSAPPADANLAPKPRVVIPPGRPDWVEADFSHEQGDTARRAVSSGPHQRKDDARRQLDEALVSATKEYVAEYLGSNTAATLVPIDIAKIRRELVPSTNFYDEQIEVADLGPMWQSHALLEFTPHFKQQLDERWRTITVTGRVAKLGVIAVGVLIALSVVFGYFKADNATRGYYTTRLQMGAAGAILALVAGGFVLFRYL